MGFVKPAKCLEKTMDNATWCLWNCNEFDFDRWQVVWPAMRQWLLVEWDGHVWLVRAASLWTMQRPSSLWDLWLWLKDRSSPSMEAKERWWWERSQQCFGGICRTISDLCLLNVSDVQGCSRMFKDVQCCSRMFKDVQGCSRMFKDVQGCYMMLNDVQCYADSDVLLQFELRPFQLTPHLRCHHSFPDPSEPSCSGPTKSVTWKSWAQQKLPLILMHFELQSKFADFVLICFIVSACFGDMAS